MTERNTPRRRRLALGVAASRSSAGSRVQREEQPRRTSRSGRQAGGGGTLDIRERRLIVQEGVVVGRKAAGRHSARSRAAETGASEPLTTTFLQHHGDRPTLGGPACDGRYHRPFHARTYGRDRTANGPR